MAEVTPELATVEVLDGYLNTHQLSSQLHRHPRTIRRYAVELGLPSILLGKTRYFRREAVAQWLRRMERSPRAARRNNSRGDK